MWRCSPQNIRELLTGPLSFSLFSGPVNQSLGFEEVVVTSCLFLKPSSSSFDGHTPTMVWAVRIGRRRKKNRFHKDNLRHLPRFPDFFVTSSWFSLHSWPVAGRNKGIGNRTMATIKYKLFNRPLIVFFLSVEQLLFYCLHREGSVVRLSTICVLKLNVNYECVVLPIVWVINIEFWDTGRRFLTHFPWTCSRGKDPISVVNLPVVKELQQQTWREDWLLI